MTEEELVMNKEDKLMEMIRKPGMDRRTFLKSCGSLLLLMGLPIELRDVFAADLTSVTAIPDHVTLTWAGDPTTTQTITWRTDSTVTSGILEFSQGGDAFDAGTKRVIAATETLKSSLGDMSLHSVTLSSLRPDTTYRYRVGDGGSNWTVPVSFTTAQTDVTSFKFLVFGDTQSGIASNPEYGPWQSNVHAAVAANPNARFLINVGDLVEAGQAYEHWDNWYAACKDIINTIPEMSCQGNHETYNRGWLPPSGASSEPYEYVHQFKVPSNGPSALKGQTYSWDYGNIHFAIVDSQYDEEVTQETKVVRFPGSTFLDLQKEWLDNDLKSTHKLWKVVIFHKTPYYNKANRANEVIKAAFTPIIDKYHVDIVFNGHDHGISRTYPIKNDAFVSSPKVGTVYYVTGRGGNKYYTDLSRKVWDQFFYDSVDSPTYVVAEVHGNTLNLKAFKENGTLVDNYSINKTTGLDTPRTVLPTPYENTQVIVYGNEAKNSAAEPINGVYNGSTWYVPLEFVTVQYGTASNLGVTGYSYDAVAEEISFTMGSTKYSFTVGSQVIGGVSKNLTNPIILQNGIPMIEVNDIKTVWGFSYKYDATFNMLLLAK